MEIKKIVWKDAEGKFSSGQEARIGKIKVGSWHWNGIDRDDKLRYVASTNLPNLKPLLGKFPTEAEAKQAVENAIKNWFNEVTN